MASSDDKAFVIIAIAFSCLGVLLGVGVGSNINNGIWERAAISKGFAEYNSVTGNWQWKESKLETKGEDAEDAN